jgi:hypothetical protein
VGLFIGDCAFVGTGLDLVEQNISSPSETCCGLKIPKARERRWHFVEDNQILSPGDFCDKPSQKWNGSFGGRNLMGPFWNFCDNLPQSGIFQNLGNFLRGLNQKMCVRVEKIESAHVPDIPCREAGGLRKFPAKIGRDQLDY